MGCRRVKVLVTGRGTSGSWEIRGRQLGAAIGAEVEAQASKIKGYDLCVIVKRAPADLLRRIRDARVPVVFDIVDAWPQPHGSEWPREQCLAWLRGQIAAIKPVGIVAATNAMAMDCAEFGLPVLWLPHHARPGQRINPVRPKAQTVGYEGSERHLGWWKGILEAECARRGWAFRLNPTHLAELDIVVALRQAQGYAARNWKSGVKLANAQGSGTPCIVGREAGYTETGCEGEYWADDTDDLSNALDALTSLEARRRAHELLLAGTITLESVAATYTAWLQGLV